VKHTCFHQRNTTDAARLIFDGSVRAQQSEADTAIEKEQAVDPRSALLVSLIENVRSTPSASAICVAATPRPG